MTLCGPPPLTPPSPPRGRGGGVRGPHKAKHWTEKHPSLASAVVRFGNMEKSRLGRKEWQLRRYRRYRLPRYRLKSAEWTWDSWNYLLKIDDSSDCFLH